MIIGVSGKSGSGKSYFSSLLATKLGFEWIDVDTEVKKIRELYKDEIVILVNDSSILVNNYLDSKKLGLILFNDGQLMKKYNDFIYGKLKEVFYTYKHTHQNIIIDSMFLPIMDVFNECDYKILLVCEEEKRKKRILDREHISEEYLKKREKFSLEYNSEDFDFIGYDNEDLLKDIVNKLESK